MKRVDGRRGKIKGDGMLEVMVVVLIILANH